MRCSKSLKWFSKLMPESRDMKSPTNSTVVRWRRIVLSMSIYSKCLGCTTACLSWELIITTRLVIIFKGPSETILNRPSLDKSVLISVDYLQDNFLETVGQD